MDASPEVDAAGATLGVTMAPQGNHPTSPSTGPGGPGHGLSTGSGDGVPSTTLGQGGGGRFVRFSVFQVDLRAGELRKRGVRLRLQQQPFRVLEMLLERPGQVVLREELRQRLWSSDTWVDFDHGVNKAVNKLRETLGDSADSPRFIETLPKRGYRFLAPVEIITDTSAPVAGGVPAPPARAVVSPAQDAPVSSPQTLRDRDTRGGLLSSHRRVYGVMLAVCAALGITAFIVWTRVPSHPPASNRLMLAVLPFANLERDPEQEYFCDGMTDEMILQLSRLKPERLGVIARTSSMHYKDTDKRIDEIASELGVQYVLEGSVRRRGPALRITARLVRREDQTPLWAESYERDVADVFDIQNDVARRISNSLALELLPGSVEGVGVPKATAAAYEAYLKGRYYWNRRTPPDLERAVASLEQAIALDPGYVHAQAALADALNVLPWYGLRPPREAYPRSKEAASRALALDQTSAAAHTALAYAHHYYDWNWQDAQRAYRRAVELNPNYAQAHQWLAAHYAELGRIDEALVEMERARQLDPRSLIINAAVGWINYLGRRFDLAIAQLRGTLELDPDFVPARLWLGQTLEASGRAQDSIEHYLRVRRIAGVAPTGLGELARGYAAAGRPTDAQQALTDLFAIARTRYVEADLIARIYEALGDLDQALAWLNRGLEERAVKMVLIGVDPQFDRLRDDARFRAMIARLNLPPERPR